jgi:DNA-binding MarR family transcriptional regulator
VLPEAAEGYTRFDEPGFLRAYAIALASEVIGGFRLLDHGPELQLLSDRDAGFTITFSIALAAAPQDGMPATGVIPVSASALAKRFHVLRSHVTRLLHDAQAAGLLERSGTLDMRIRFLPLLTESFEKLFGSLLLWHAACARHALGENGAPGASQKNTPSFTAVRPS